MAVSSAGQWTAMALCPNSIRLSCAPCAAARAATHSAWNRPRSRGLLQSDKHMHAHLTSSTLLLASQQRMFFTTACRTSFRLETKACPEKVHITHRISLPTSPSSRQCLCKVCTKASMMLGLRIQKDSKFVNSECRPDSTMQGVNRYNLRFAWSCGSSYQFCTCACAPRN